MDTTKRGAEPGAGANSEAKTVVKVKVEVGGKRRRYALAHKARASLLRRSGYRGSSGVHAGTNEASTGLHIIDASDETFTNTDTDGRQVLEPAVGGGTASA